ncbi:ATP-binding protein [Desulfofundulus sp.]|uniref:ATP-binding protein n=1 Tax=Desulfofundulus sp. TaxID=2282750 RepID=UPI003C716D0F
MLSLGIVLSATYDTFKFRSALRVLSDSFVVTPLNGNAFLFGRVTGAKTESPTNITYEVSVLRRGETHGSEITFFAPRETAVPGAEVYEPSPEVVARALGFDTDPAKSLHVGRAGGVDVCLRPDILLRHIFVGGTTGSGKSYFASVLMEELAKLQVPAVAMDSQADYLEHAEALGGAVVCPGVDYAVPLSSLTTEEAVQVVAALEGTPGYDLFAFSFAALQKEIDMGRKKAFTLTDLLKQMEQDGMHDLRLTGYEFRAAMSRVEASIRRHRFLGTMGRNLDWAALLKTGKPVAVDCSSLDLLQFQLVVGATLRELQRLRLAGKIPQFVTFLDEAHLLVPFDRRDPVQAGDQGMRAHRAALRDMHGADHPEPAGHRPENNQPVQHAGDLRHRAGPAGSPARHQGGRYPGHAAGHTEIPPRDIPPVGDVRDGQACGSGKGEGVENEALEKAWGEV